MFDEQSCEEEITEEFDRQTPTLFDREAQGCNRSPLQR